MTRSDRNVIPSAARDPARKRFELGRARSLAALGMTVATFAVILSLAAITLALWLDRPLPPALLDAGAPGLVLLDRAGLPLRSTRAGDGDLRRWVPLGDLDPDVIAAFLAVEDRRFYAHQGVDPRALARAALADIRARRIVSGGSTMTMQLARLLRPGGRTWTGKASQVRWALRLERRLPKQTILEQYLNRVPLGQGAVGVEAAAGLYFGAHAAELSLGQAALLAGLARAPSGDNPLVSPRRARARRTSALARLVATGYASALSADAPGRSRCSAGDGRHLRPALHDPRRAVERAGAARAAPRAARCAPRSTSRCSSCSRPRSATRRDAVRPRRGPGRGRRSGQRHRRGAGLGRLARLLGRHRGAGGHGRPHPASRARPSSRSCTRSPSTAATAASILPDIARVYQTATGPYSPQLRPPIPRAGPRARGAGELVQSGRRGAREPAWRRQPAPSAPRGRLRLARADAEYYGLGLSLGNGDVTLLEWRTATERSRTAVSGAPGSGTLGSGRAAGARAPDRHGGVGRAGARHPR